MSQRENQKGGKQDETGPKVNTNYSKLMGRRWFGIANRTIANNCVNIQPGI